MISVRKLVDEFNSDFLDDFRHVLVNRMKSSGKFKSGQQIFEAFQKSYEIYSEFSLFPNGENYNNFIECFFNILGV